MKTLQQLWLFVGLQITQVTRSLIFWRAFSAAVEGLAVIVKTESSKEGNSD
jgi:hypothetical protein